MRTYSILAATLLVAGCTTVQNRIDPAGESLTAQLMARSGSTVGGTAQASAGAGGTTVTVDIRGAVPGARLPWHIHRGTCGSNGPIVGAANAYPMLMVTSTGRATATATIATNIEDGDYYVNIHASPDNLATIVACGELDD